MNVRIWKWIGLVVFVATLVCAITYANKDERKEISLPGAVKDAVKASYPQGTIEKTKTEREFEVFEVVVKQNGQESEPSIAPDGTIISVESKVGKGNLPDVVAKALSKAAEGAEIKGIDQEVTYFVIKPVKLDSPETTYEAKLTKDGKECEVKFAANGNILEKSDWQKHEGKDEEKCEDNEEKEEQEVSIDQVPAAVKATILGQAGNGTVKEIEKETKDGKTIYGADIIIDGNKFEIKVSPDGKLLDKQAEGKDEENNDAKKGE